MQDMSRQSPFGKKIGILTPATNLTVEDELWSMRVPGATIATARIPIEQVQWKTDADLEKFVKGVLKEIPSTAARVMQADPDLLLMGISSSNLWGGVKSNSALKAQVKKQTGRELVTPVDAIIRALKIFKATRIGVVTPYPAIADAHVVAFFEEIGVEVVRQKGLRCKSATEIAKVPPEVLCSALSEVAVKKAQAIVTLGTDLLISQIGAEAELWLKRPVMAVNSTTWWHALRTAGVKAQIPGWGTLLECH